ncbi:hypothetical protein DIPPA_23940 [Diplonema papillatum]|nr:hypothetical protein DIPPA_23940 [Diplonema papillatum]
MIDNVHKIVGVSFVLLNFGGQFLVGTQATEVVLVVIGCFIHLVAACLMGFAMIMVVQSIIQSQVLAKHTNSTVNQQNDMDSIVIYFIFCMTGLALTCIGIVLRKGSFYWNFATIILGLIASYCADPSVRKKLMSQPLLATEEVDTWSVRKEAPGAPGNAAPGNVRQRF